MASLTVRDIPDDLLDQLRVLSKTDRRSLNNEIIHTLEAGLQYRITRHTAEPGPILSRDTQLSLWESLCGQWIDTGNWERTAEVVYRSRTDGREVDL